MALNNHPSLNKHSVHVYVTDEGDVLIPADKVPKKLRLNGEPDKRYKKQNQAFFEFEDKILKKQYNSSTQ